MELKGRIKVIKEVQIISEKFAKREFVITVPDGNYPQDIVMEMINDNCGILDSFNVGEEVSAEINLRGREWKSPQGEVKYFNTLQAWRIARAENFDPSNPKGLNTKVQGNTEKRFEDDAIDTMKEDDDLPF
jgi:hypothetical protein